MNQQRLNQTVVHTQFDKESTEFSNRTYSDLDLGFGKHPVSNDVIKKRGESAIKQSVKVLLLTQMGDRMFRPLVGSGVYNQLFEPMTTSTIVSMRNGIENVINRYEPRCVVSRVDVHPTDNENGIEISVVVSLINDPTPITIDVFLERLR